MIKEPGTKLSDSIKSRLDWSTAGNGIHGARQKAKSARQSKRREAKKQNETRRKLATDQQPGRQND